MSDTHEMFAHSRDSTGRILWKCTVCPRKLIMRFQPYEKIVLEEGPEGSTHTGGLGGVRVGNAEVIPVYSSPTDKDLEFLKSFGIEWDSD